MDNIEFNFWANVDMCNPYKTIRGLCNATGLDYWNTAQQRSKNIIPKADVLLRISNAVHKSIEYLLTGKDRKEYPPRIEAIARRCLYFASEEDLFLIEHILKMPSEYEIVKKGSEKNNVIA